MPVTDRWHKSRPKAGDKKCSCKPGRAPTADHGCEYRWQVRWRDDAGQQKKESFARLPQAQARDVEIQAALRGGDYIDPRAGSVKLADFGRGCVDNLMVDMETRHKISLGLERWVFTRPLGQLTLAFLAKNPERIQRWIREQEEELKPGSIQKNAQNLSTIFNIAVDNRLINRNPFHVKSVRIPTAEPKKVVPLTVDQVRIIGEELPARYRGLPFLGAGCGLRLGEMLGVGLDDIDFLGRTVYIRRQLRVVYSKRVFSLPKHNKERRVPLPESVALQLAAHIRENPPVPVTLPWRTPNGKPETVKLLITSNVTQPVWPSCMRRIWDQVRAPAGMPAGREFGTHVLRHTAASAWLAAGVDIRTVSEFLGHSDPGFTLRTYTHLLPDASDRARIAMDAFFQSESCAPDVPDEDAI